MKIAKKLFKILLWILGIVVAIVLTLPLWIGPVVKTAANAVVPKKTGTAFNLGVFGLNPYSGKLAVGDVQLWNPEGFGQKMAVTLGSLNVEVDVASLAGDPIVIKEIALKDVFVSYVMNGKGESNFAVIQRNAKGEEEQGGGGRTKVEQRTDSNSTVQPPTSDLQPSSSTSKKVIVDRLLIQNVMVQLGPIPIPNPMNIELTGIGRKSNGVTMQEAWNQICAQVMQNFNAIGINIDGLVNGIGNADLDKALKAVGAVGDLSKKEGRKKAVKNLVDAFVGGVDIVGGAAGQTKDAVGDSAKQAGDAVGDGAKRATDAVNEQTDKAVNALKGLFK